MRQELQNIEYIEHYLEGALSNADKYKFEQLMQEDSDFKKAVELQRQIISQLKEEAFLADVSAYHEEFMTQNRSSNWRFWLLVPVLLLTATLLVWWALFSPAAEEQAAGITPQELSNSNHNINQENIKPYKADATFFAETKAFQTPFISKKIIANEGATFQLKGSKSVLHIPPNAVLDKNGKPVTGSYEIQYRELKDKAQMAFSAFPMNYKNNAGTHNFNSAGLLEVRAFKGGEALQLAPNKKLGLDYEVSNRLPNLDFYQLDDAAQTWAKTKEKVNLPKKGAYTEEFDSLRYNIANAKHQEKFGEFIKFKQEAIREGKNWKLNKTKIWQEGIEKIEEEERPDPNKYVVKHKANPKLVKELKLNSFGVYNCSQLYQIKNQIAISALYTNQQKEAIDNARLLSIIDLNYNAAYSFLPEQFICNGKANNVFLLWSNEGKLYSFVKRAHIELGTGKYSFAMEDLSQSVRNTSDLRKYLKFVEKKAKETVTKN